MSIKLLPRTIRGLTLMTAIASGLATALLGLATYALVHEEIEHQINQRIKVEADSLLDYHREHGFAALARIIDARERRRVPEDPAYLEGADETGRGMGYILTDAKGVRRAGSLRAAIPPRGWSEFVRFRKMDGTDAVAQAMHKTLPGGGHLIVAADRSVNDEMDLSLLELFALGFGLVLASGFLAVFGLGRLVRHRLADIERSARGIMEGDFSRRVSLNGSNDEFDRLSLILNRMLDRIQALMDNLRRVSSDIAHDMRTPLNRLRARLEAVAKGGIPSSSQQLVDAALTEMDDLLELFSSILAIAEIEGQTVRSRFVRVDMVEVAAEILDAYGPSFAQAGMSINHQLARAEVPGDRYLLQRLLSNLLDNILIHTPSGTVASVRIERRKGSVALIVADDGPGIALADQDRAFQQLTRLDASRSTPGHGLGLSMVSTIVKAHGGRIRIVPAPAGLKFEILLPTDCNGPSQGRGGMTIVGADRAAG
jgi:signal transduction histidine kinase